MKTLFSFLKRSLSPGKKAPLSLLFATLSLSSLWAWSETSVNVPAPPQEFRAAWIATVHNIDWPSRSGLSAQGQKEELIAILNKAQELHLNALIFQVRPQGDALYESAYEPWSQWLTGTQGKHPGYDPLAFLCHEAHQRGLEVHAWFNPFRAAANPKHAVASSHIMKQRPDLVRPAGGQVWVDPGHPEASAMALRSILDVTKRYDVDGIHLDDYFYPYPFPGQSWSPNQFNDQATYRRFGSGNKSAWRRSVIDNFVQKMYSSIKSTKSWVRVGISPFGIWRPGVPQGIEAGIDAYEQLAADSRKWLSKGWLDYLAPQLYWRCEPTKQSFPLLLNWWRDQSSSRPVFPGVASARIKASEDPSRPASEILRQLQYTRKIQKGTKQNGLIFWSMKSLMQNRDGLCSQLKSAFTAPALPPAMPWISASLPSKPQIFAATTPTGTKLYWKAQDSSARKWVVQAYFGGKWHTLSILPAKASQFNIPPTYSPSLLSVRGVSSSGEVGSPAVLKS